ncbi:hypothetical protein AB395_00002777 [Sinorhizobium fredii CCBAU 45436]|nr:hypothetical protein AB395_00002777 [Sinorhizobium fredii CCBAU 45436]AWM26198.1 hypothetical protein AOX55_00002949 [Sinorhizobium fredii CCBAU 25509]
MAKTGLSDVFIAKLHSALPPQALMPSNARIPTGNDEV